MPKKNHIKSKILTELINFFEEILAPYLDKKFDGVENRLDNVENKLENVESDIRYIKMDIRDLKTDMPTKKEFTVVRKLEKIHQKELSSYSL